MSRDMTLDKSTFSHDQVFCVYVYLCLFSIYIPSANGHSSCSGFLHSNTLFSTATEPGRLLKVWPVFCVVSPSLSLRTIQGLRKPAVPLLVQPTCPVIKGSSDIALSVCPSVLKKSSFRAVAAFCLHSCPFLHPTVQSLQLWEEFGERGSGVLAVSQFHYKWMFTFLFLITCCFG